MDEEDPFENDNPFSDADQRISVDDSNNSNNNNNSTTARRVMEGVASVSVTGAGGAVAAYAVMDVTLGVTLGLSLAFAGGAIAVAGLGLGAYFIYKHIKEKQD